MRPLTVSLFVFRGRNARRTSVQSRERTVLPRFRLRFLLQEFDLVGPEVVLGRSPDCHITIEDPLISRRHAKISIREEEAKIADLGSRNGVRVNGRSIDEEHVLSDGDRIRLGTQE
ncbi:MAG TPA: hypothetical protein DEF51_38405, partial [Myxococcales bacterium]|nr:hypothetical protein [Myxococcales bacterium]